MKIAAITITFNRLELTKRMLESFYQRTSVDYHLIIDNGSTDGTREFIEMYDRVLLDRNYGIAYAFTSAVNTLSGYDFVLKLDNDIEVVTYNIVEKMLKFYELNGMNYVTSPTDLLLDPNFEPPKIGKANLNGYNCEFTSHTGGAFQMIPWAICRKLCDEYRMLAKGDYAIGLYYQRNGYKPTYLRDLEMRHVGLNQSTPGNLYIM